MHQKLAMGLGINTMEGKEAKHVNLAKFTQNTQFSNRCSQFMSMSHCFGYGRMGVMKLCTKPHAVGLYVPKRCNTSQFCYCGEPKQVAEKQCTFCCDPLRDIISKCVVEGKITNAAKEVLDD